MAFASITADAVWTARIAEKIIRPAVFVYLDWPSGEIFASTHHQTVTTNDTTVSPTADETWTGVGNFHRIEAPEFKRSGAQVTYKIGLTSLPSGDITEATEAAAIGRRAIMHLGLFDKAWANPVLKRIFIGHILSAGDFKHRRDTETGDWVTDATVEASNGRSPRRSLQHHHSPETAEGTDTAWRLLGTVARVLEWPNP